MKRTRAEINRTRALRHGQAGSGRETREYRIWKNMLNRCRNKKTPAFANYGGRGVVVCKRWDKFEIFFSDLGPAPSSQHTIDRYPNQNGNYEPGNVRWATRAEQSRNTRRNNIIAFRGESLCEGDWCRRLGVVPGTVRRRLALGWSIERAVTSGPIRDGNPKVRIAPREVQP